MVNINLMNNTQRPSPSSPQCEAEPRLGAGEGLDGTACSASSFVLKTVEDFDNASVTRELKYISDEVEALKEQVNYVKELIKLRDSLALKMKSENEASQAL